MSVHTDDVIVDSGVITGNQGTPNTLPNAWPIEITDGTNVLGTVAHPVQVGGTVATTQLSSSSATVTSVVVPATTDTVLLAANANRKKAIIFIPSKGFIKFGSGASATSFTYNANANNATVEVTIWTGAINIFAPVGETVLVTELT